MVSIGLATMVVCIAFALGLALGIKIWRDTSSMGRHIGIELRLSVDGRVTLQGDSDYLHYCALYSGGPEADWSRVASWSTCRGVVSLELRAAELPDLDTELAELEPELGAAAAVTAAGLAGVDQAAADVRPPAAALAELAELRARVDADINAAAPVPASGTGAASLTELSTQDARRRAPGRRRPAGPGRAIARIARQVLFRSPR